MSHKLQRRFSGEGPMSGITPTCSCGWVGTTHHAYEDYQLTLIKRNEARHLRDVQDAGNQTGQPDPCNRPIGGEEE